MKLRSARRVRVRRRLLKTVDPEEKWYDIVPVSHGTPMWRPSNENTIRGLTNASREADRRNGARRPEDQGSVFRPLEVTKPRATHKGQGRPKYDDRKGR